MEKSENTKQRLDVRLVEQHPGTSRSTWQKHIKAGHVQINGNVVTTPKVEVRATDTVIASPPQPTDFSDQTLPIIYQDDDVIVVNKPTGVLTHSKGALHHEFTVADFFGRFSTFHDDTDRPGIVHRLDRDTSGVIIGARTPEAGEWLQKQFARRKVVKTYMAIVASRLKEPTARIELPIGRNPKAPSTFRVDAGGKSATTTYRTLATSQNESLVELTPLTGRTHQLRVHMQYLAAPILGDRVYGKSADRLYLHAFKLEIKLPNGQQKTFIAPIPAEFKAHFPQINYD